MKIKIIYIFWLLISLPWSVYAFESVYLDDKNQVALNSISSKVIDIKSTNLGKALNDLSNDDKFKIAQRQSLYDYINNYRAINKLSTLTLNVKLETSAQKFASYLSSVWELTHFWASWDTAADRFTKEWLKNSYRWEIISSSVDLSGAVQSRKDSPLHRQVFNSQIYNSIWIWYDKWMRVVVYYYDKNITTAKKTCSIRNYKKVKNKQVATTCKQYK